MRRATLAAIAVPQLQKLNRIREKLQATFREQSKQEGTVQYYLLHLETNWQTGRDGPMKHTWGSFNAHANQFNSTNAKTTTTGDVLKLVEQIVLWHPALSAMVILAYSYVRMYLLAETVLAFRLRL